jgi:hypothetical protein
MRIVSVHGGSLPITSLIWNASTDFTTMNCTIAVVVNDVVRTERLSSATGSAQMALQPGDIVRR